MTYEFPFFAHKINELTITNAVGTKYDVKGVMVSLNLFESIDDRYIYGTILLLSENDLIKDVPLIGNETLTISFTNKGNNNEYVDDYEKEFRIVSLNNSSQSDAVGTEHITLRFVSLPYFEQKGTLISKAFTGTLSNIVGSMLAVMGVDGPDNIIESCIYPVDYVAPMVTPMEVIDFVCQNSVSGETNSSNLVFFENKTGWNFVSIPYLKKQKPVAVFSIYPSKVEISDRFRINSHNRDTIFDINQQSAGGMGARYYTYDLLSKSVNTETYDYYQYKEETEKFNEGDFYVDKEIKQSNDYMTIVEVVGENNKFENSKQRLNRIASRRIERSSEITIQISGNCDVKCGDVVELNVSQDESLSGLWLIYSLAHVLSQGEYTMNLGLARGDRADFGRTL